MRDHLHALGAGTVLEGYEIERTLGSGGFGITYLARDTALDKPVAIKEYMPSDLAVRQATLSVSPRSSQVASDFEWGLSRFLDEARVLARFDHPNVVRVFRFFEAHGTAYIVMDFVAGETLGDILTREGRLPERRLREIVEGLLRGLETVHGGGFLHRDIKPGNVILRPDGTPVLLDFGSARQSVTAKSRSVTAIVTPGYAPIEQYSSRGNQGPWTDIYAVGAICYRAMTGEVPVDATERVRRDPLVPVSEHPVSKGAYSPALLAAVDEALKVDEDARPQSVAGWRAFLSGEHAPTDKLTPARPADPVRSPAQKGRPQKGRGGLVAAGLVSVVLGAIGAGLLLWPDVVPSGAALDDSMAAPSLAQEETAPQPSVPETAATRRVGDMFRDGFTSGSGNGPEMVVLPSGNFTMGSPVGEDGRWADEGPQRSVRIGYEFAVGRYEVTWSQYFACVSAGACRAAEDDMFGKGSRPVTNVSWNDAQKYLSWLNERTGLTGRSDRYRLLSEAEWEYAARAGSQARWSFGDDESRLGNFAWFLSNSGSRTQPVGGKTANGFGLHDMHGNVWEWVEDCYEARYSVQPSDGSSHPSDDSAFTKSSCSIRVGRGGSWFSAPQVLRSAVRGRYAPGGRSSDLGFRVARTL